MKTESAVAIVGRHEAMAATPIAANQWIPALSVATGRPRRPAAMTTPPAQACVLALKMASRAIVAVATMVGTTDLGRIKIAGNMKTQMVMLQLFVVDVWSVPSLAFRTVKKQCLVIGRPWVMVVNSL